MPIDLRKPMKGDGKLRRYERRVEARAAKRKADKAKQLAQTRLNRAIRAAIYFRDNGQCRACGMPLYLEAENPFVVLHAHHVTYRSAGGSDFPHNRVSLCPADHKAEHDALLEITGEPNGIIYFVRKDKKQNVVRAWESTPTHECPEVAG